MPSRLDDLNAYGKGLCAFCDGFQSFWNGVPRGTQSRQMLALPATELGTARGFPCQTVYPKI